MNTGVKIFLIGFMGSGKSHWGKIWADHHNFKLVDLDEEIVKSSGMSIETIFEKFGEQQFREWEREQLKRTEDISNVLIACGGGVPCFFDNMDWMLKNGKVVYLKASPDYIYQRVSGETEKRPLLKKLNPMELMTSIQERLNEREPIYLRAHFTLNVEELNNDSLETIISQVEE